MYFLTLPGGTHSTMRYCILQQVIIHCTLLCITLYSGSSCCFGVPHYFGTSLDHRSRSYFFFSNKSLKKVNYQYQSKSHCSLHNNLLSSNSLNHRNILKLKFYLVKCHYKIFISFLQREIFSGINLLLSTKFRVLGSQNNFRCRMHHRFCTKSCVQDVRVF